MRTNAPAEPRHAVETLFGAYRRRILALLLLHPEESLHVREIARLTKMPAGSLHRELVALADTGLLVRSRSGNQVMYRADVSHPLFEDLAGIFRKTAGLADVLRDALAPLGPAVQLALVFGSVASGQHGPASDVDLLVVGDVPFAEVVVAVQAATSTLRREVNPVVMTPDDFERRRAASDRFLTRILAEPYLLLLGTLDEPRESGAHRAAQTSSGRSRRGGAAAGRGTPKPRRREHR